MKTRLMFVALLACAGVAFFAGRRAAGTGNANVASPGHASGAQDKTPRVRRAPRAQFEANATPEPAKPTFAAAREHVRALYRNEQLTRELDLEQQRYGARYWDSECDGRDFARLQSAREALVRQLTDEANAVLRELYPSEALEPIALRTIFDAEHAGPNVRFLSPEARERFEAALLSTWGEARLDTGVVLAVAERAMAAEEFAEFTRWNAPAAVALRERLVGFDASEQEFRVLLRAISDADGEAALVPAEFSPERAERLRQIEEPALRTALRDVRRLGLPLTEADWLAATRAQAAASIQRAWDDPGLSFGAKQGQVALLERTFSRAIADRFGLPGSSIDELHLRPE